MILPEVGKRIALGFLCTGRKIAFLGGFGICICLIGFAVVFPLWYFSTNYSKGYTVFVLAVIAFFLLYTIIRGTTRLKEQHGNLLKVFTKGILPGFIKVLKALIGLFILYVIILLFSKGFLLIAVLFSIIYLAVIGYLKYAGKK